MLNEDRGKKSVDYGCLMCFISDKDSKKIIKIGKDIISDDVLYTKEEGMGRELEEIHITIKYGFFPDLTKKEIENLIKDVIQFKATLKSISQFKNKEKGFDVVKYDVESDVIKKLNKAACEFPNEDSHPIYHPHLTLAYVKSNSFDEKDTVVDMEVTIDKIVYSPIKGEKMHFDLPKEKLDEAKLSSIKEKRFLFLTYEIPKIEREIERLDSMGGMENEIRELNIKLQKYQYELSGWNNYNPLNENINYKTYFI